MMPKGRPPLQHGNKSAKKQLQPKIYAYVSRLPLDHKIVIPINEFRTNYPHLIKRINKICTRGGTRCYGKNSTFLDPTHLGFILRFVGSYLGREIDTSLFYIKQDVYVVGYCKVEDDLVESNWICAMESPVEIYGSQKAKFGIDYGNLNGCMVGFDVFGQALYQLKYNDDGESFLKMAHHISEAVRNTEVMDRVYESFQRNENLSIDVYHFHHWNSYSKLWCTDFFKLDPVKQEVHLERFRTLGIRNMDDLGSMLQVLLMENQEDRIERRSTAIKLRSSGSVSIDNIKRKTKLGLRKTAQELQLYRKDILKELMIKGDPNIWICINDALREPDLRYAKLKIQHTDLFVMKRDLSECVDDEGDKYVIDDELMLCEDAS